MSTQQPQSTGSTGSTGADSRPRPGCASVDTLSRPVPSRLAELLEAWTQGAYVDGVPAVWAGPEVPDLLFDDDAPQSPDTAGLVDVAVDGVAGLFEHTIVTTQTCDVVGTGPGEKHPWVQVSPVMRLPDDVATDKLGRIDRYEVPYLAPLSQGPRRDSTGRWVADLRLSLPVSKAALAQRTPRLAFASDEDAIAFARHTARKVERPALHDALSEALPRSVGAWVKQHGKKDLAWWQNVEQLRLRVTGSRLRPRAAAVVLLAETALTPEQEVLWRGWQASFARSLLRDHNIVLEPVQFTSLDDLPSRQFADTLWLRVPELKRLPPAL